MGNILRGVLTCVRRHSVRVDVEYATLILNILCLDSMGKVRKRRRPAGGPAKVAVSVPLDPLWSTSAGGANGNTRERCPWTRLLWRVPSAFELAL